MVRESFGAMIFPLLKSTPCAEEMRQSIEQIKTLIERKDWPQAKAAAIRLRYQQGIDRAAKKWQERRDVI